MRKRFHCFHDWLSVANACRCHLKSCVVMFSNMLNLLYTAATIPYFGSSVQGNASAEASRDEPLPG